MSPVLNEDCLEVVILYCCDRTLFSWLTVSRRMFDFAAPVLYAHPFDPSPSRSTTRLSIFSRDRLQYLLANSTGYLHSAFKNVQPPWENPVTQPYFTNYYALVKTLPDRPFLFSWDQSKSFSTNKSHGGFHRYLFSHYVEHHGPKLTSITISLNQVARMIELVPRLLILESVSFQGAPPMPLEVADKNRIRTFVTAHLALFPGRLKSLGMTNHNWQWDFYTELQQLIQQSATTQARSLSVDVNHKVNYELMPTSTIRELDYQSHHQGQYTTKWIREEEAFLSKFRNLEHLTLGKFKHGAFNWAKAEQEMCQQGMTLDRPLVNLKHLKYEYETIHAFYLLCGFQHSLEKVELIHTGSPQRSAMTTGLTMALPKLKKFRVIWQLFDVDTLAKFCPNLESIEADLTNHTKTFSWPISQFPVGLTRLVLVGSLFTAMNIRALKPLIHLQELRLETTDEDEKAPIVDDLYEQLARSGQELLQKQEQPPNVVTDESDNDDQSENEESSDEKAGRQTRRQQPWSFPFLTTVFLKGRWAIQFQLSLLWVSPRLSSLTLECLYRCPIELDVDLYMPPGTKWDSAVKPLVHTGLTHLALTNFILPAVPSPMVPNDQAWWRETESDKKNKGETKQKVKPTRKQKKMDELRQQKLEEDKARKLTSFKEILEGFKYLESVQLQNVEVDQDQAADLVNSLLRRGRNAAEPGGTGGGKMEKVEIKYTLSFCGSWTNNQKQKMHSRPFEEGKKLIGYDSTFKNRPVPNGCAFVEIVGHASHIYALEQ